MERRFRGELKFEMTFVRRTELSLILKHPSGPNLIKETLKLYMVLKLLLNSIFI